MGVTGSCRMVLFRLGFLLRSSRKPSSILESQDLKPIVPIDVCLSRGHVDVEGFPEWQFSRVFGLVHHCGHFQSDGVVILPNTLCYC